MIGAIVAISANGVIGLDGGLPWHYPVDFKRFKQVTLGSTIIMGRKTWDSLPRRPLPERRNIVISRRAVADVEHYASIEEALAASDEPVWIIGGAEIYRLALPHCDTLDITRVPDVVEDANAVVFPDIDDDWQLKEQWTNPDDERLCHQIYTRTTRESAHN